MKRLLIDLDHLPEEGKQYEGALDGEIFGIDNEEVANAGSLVYDLFVQRFEGELFVRGSMEAPFRFRCARCLKMIEIPVRVADYSGSFDIGGRTAVDITDELREDILLAFPLYPKCEDADEKNACDIKNSYFGVDKQGQSGVNSSAPSGDGSVWDALDSLGK